MGQGKNYSSSCTVGLTRKGSLFHNRLFWSLVFVFAVLIVLGIPSARAGQDPLLEGPALGGLTLQQVGDSLVELEIKGTNLPTPELRRERPGELEFFFFNVSLPSGSWEKDYNAPLVRKVILEQEPRGVSMRIETMAELVMHRLRGVAPGNRFSLELTRKDRTEAPEALPSPPLKPYSCMDPLNNSTPVTLELQGADLKDVFRMLGKTMNMNILCDPSLPSIPVTLSLRHVPMKEAFAYLMRMYDVRYAIMGKTLLVGKGAELSRALGQEVTRNYAVAYGDPAKVADLVKALAHVEKITVDERMRELYITASPSKLYEVEKVLQRVDHPGKQIMIQARIVETKGENQDSLESLVSGVYKHWHFSYGAGGGTIGYVDSNVVDYDGKYAYDPGTRDLIPLPKGIDAEDVMNSTMSMLDAGLNSMVETRQADILAKPSVITVAGKKATVKLTQQTKYISGKDESGNPTYGDVEAGPTLEFLPTIGRKDMINLEIKISTGTVTFKKSGSALFPEKNAREVETKIRVRNGEPFVIGGLFQREQNENETKFPILGDLPILGEIFRFHSTKDTVTEVAIVVVPYILDVPEGPVKGLDVLQDELVTRGY